MISAMDFQTRINRLSRSSGTGVPGDMMKDRTSRALARSLRKVSRPRRRASLLTRLLAASASPAAMFTVVWIAVGTDVQRHIPDDIALPPEIAAMPSVMMERLRENGIDLSNVPGSDRLARTYALITD